MDGRPPPPFASDFYGSPRFLAKASAPVSLLAGGARADLPPGTATIDLGGAHVSPWGRGRGRGSLSPPAGAGASAGALLRTN